jgi:hypothetical protein
MVVDDLPSFEHMEKAFQQYYFSSVDRSTIKSDVLKMIYNHWREKRRRERIPLIYRLLKPPDPEDPSPYRAFRHRGEEEKLKRKGRKNDQSSLVKMKQLRLEMERARTILEMIKKRERQKKEVVEYVSQIFELQCIEASFPVSLPSLVFFSCFNLHSFHPAF